MLSSSLEFWWVGFVKNYKSESILQQFSFQHSLQRRCHMENLQVLAMTTILEPQFKIIVFANPTKRNDAVRRLAATFSLLIFKTSPLLEDLSFPVMVPTPSTSDRRASKWRSTVGSSHHELQQCYQ